MKWHCLIWTTSQRGYWLQWESLCLRDDLITHKWQRVVLTMQVMFTRELTIVCGEAQPSPLEWTTQLETAVSCSGWITSGKRVVLQCKFAYMFRFSESPCITKQMPTIVKFKTSPTPDSRLRDRREVQWRIHRDVGRLECSRWFERIPFISGLEKWATCSCVRIGQRYSLTIFVEVLSWISLKNCICKDNYP